MSTDLHPHTPLVSVVIPCYNHASYLPEAVQSVQQQDYPAIEIVVVDDGSKDNTAAVAKSLAGVKYVYQKNAGLSAARNTGIKNSSGEFLVFLDADDWLMPGAISTNVSFLLQHPDAAFVSGGHDKIYTDSGTIQSERSEVTSNHYLHFLKGNYIGMIATVMFRRRVFEEFQYDTTLKACEDYDLYLKIARKYPVVHHSHNLAAYRLHSSNMSNNIPMMLQVVHQVLDRQKTNLRTPQEKEAWSEGKKIWERMYCQDQYDQLWYHPQQRKASRFLFLLQRKPRLFIKFLVTKLFPCLNRS